MKDEYLTIAEFAKQAGVTRQAVYKRLSTDLFEFTKVDNGTKLINSKALRLYGAEPLSTELTHTFTDLATYFDKQNEKFDRLIDVLEADNAKLHQELDVKNRQIAAQNKQIEDLTRLTDQAHVLADQQQKLNAHALLNGSRQDPDPSPVDQDEIDAAYRKGKDDAQKQMVRIAKALSRNFPDAADFLIAEFSSDPNL